LTVLKNVSNGKHKLDLTEIYLLLFSSPNISPVGITSGGAVINNNVRRRKAEDKMAMIFIAIVSW